MQLYFTVLNYEIQVQFTIYSAELEESEEVRRKRRRKIRAVRRTGALRRVGYRGAF